GLCGRFSVSGLGLNEISGGLCTAPYRLVKVPVNHNWRGDVEGGECFFLLGAKDILCPPASQERYPKEQVSFMRAKARISYTRSSRNAVRSDHCADAVERV
ncbi:MAG: hypothetical protein O6826_04660, partial [Acidobacteria bacterium]|nr:hypothetical protein [Acidobacteriota bacterium]